MFDPDTNLHKSVHPRAPSFMESGLDDNAAELAMEMEKFVSDLMMQPDREQVASEIGGEYLWFLGSRAL